MPPNTSTSCQVREQPPKASSSRQLRPHMPSVWASRSPGSAPRPLPALARQDGGRPEVPEQRRDRRLQQERTCCGCVKSDLTHLDEQPCHEPLKPQRPYDTGQGARHVGTHVGVVCLEDFVEELQISLERHLHHRQLKVARRSAGLDPGSLHTSAIVMATQEPVRVFNFACVTHGRRVQISYRRAVVMSNIEIFSACNHAAALPLLCTT